MADLKRLQGLQRLSQMHADLAMTTLARARVQEELIEAHLRGLANTPTFPPNSPFEAQAATKALAWRKKKKRALMTALAEERARTQPLKEETAFKIARANALQKAINKASKKKARDG